MAFDHKKSCHPWPTIFPTLCFNQVSFVMFQVLSDHLCAFPTAQSEIQAEELVLHFGDFFL